METLVIEYPSVGKTYHTERYGVYSYGVYERGSVLEGQEKRSFRGQFDTLEEAQEIFPEAKWNGGGSGYREVFLPHAAPSWFDEANAGERWDDDY
jgi:hypothetical protein